MWLDPRTAIELADELVTRLSTLKPAQESTFQMNAARFKRIVADLMEQTSAAINRRAGGGPFVTLDRGFVPLALRFGMTEVRVGGISSAQPSDYNVRQIRQIAADAGAGAIFLSSELPPPLVRDWQSRLGEDLAVLTLDPLGTSAPTGRSTYLAMLRYNLEQLVAGAARSRPTTRTATTQYRAETVDPSERAPFVPEPPAETEPAPRATPAAPANPIKVPPIPNPLAPVAQPRAPTTTRPTRPAPPVPENPFAPRG
jgi:hypothetical protein